MGLSRAGTFPEQELCLFPRISAFPAGTREPLAVGRQEVSSSPCRRSMRSMRSLDLPKELQGSALSSPTGRSQFAAGEVEQGWSEEGLDPQDKADSRESRILSSSPRLSPTPGHIKSLTGWAQHCRAPLIVPREGMALAVHPTGSQFPFPRFPPTAWGCPKPAHLGQGVLWKALGRGVAPNEGARATAGCPCPQPLSLEVAGREGGRKIHPVHFDSTP